MRVLGHFADCKLRYLQAYTCTGLGLGSSQAGLGIRPGSGSAVALSRLLDSSDPIIFYSDVDKLMERHQAQRIRLWLARERWTN